MESELTKDGIASSRDWEIHSDDINPKIRNTTRNAFGCNYMKSLQLNTKVMNKVTKKAVKPNKSAGGWVQICAYIGRRVWCLTKIFGPSQARKGFALWLQPARVEPRTPKVRVWALFHWAMLFPVASAPTSPPAFKPPLPLQTSFAAPCIPCPTSDQTHFHSALITTFIWLLNLFTPMREASICWSASS